MLRLRPILEMLSTGGRSIVWGSGTMKLVVSLRGWLFRHHPTALYNPNELETGPVQIPRALQACSARIAGQATQRYLGHVFVLRSDFE